MILALLNTHMILALLIQILISGIEDLRLEKKIGKLKGKVQINPKLCTHLVTNYIEGKNGEPKRVKITGKLLAVCVCVRARCAYVTIHVCHCNIHEFQNRKMPQYALLKRNAYP
jgi:hypothetical protein